jgi:endonuclease/exonuclease/phosphatase family metal-dependent hydrolase
MRLCTFNVENLFTRYLFAKGVDRAHAARHGFQSEDLRFRLADPASKQLTAALMQRTDADVFALQEVEDLDTLKAFRDRYLGGREAYPHALVIDGNDPRRIDVGVLSRFPIVHARTWQHLWNEDGPVFDRDCLEVDVESPTLGRVTIYVNHFKSMRAPRGAQGPGRRLTRDRRVAQARRVRQLVEARFDEPSTARFVVAGDLNDHLAATEEGTTGIADLVRWQAVENVLDRLHARDRWTHHFPGSRRHGLPEAYRQLDYLLVSRALARANPHPPLVFREGLPKRARRYTGAREPGTGRNRPKASDHCPLCFDLLSR